MPSVTILFIVTVNLLQRISSQECRETFKLHLGVWKVAVLFNWFIQQRINI